MKLRDFLTDFADFNYVLNPHGSDETDIELGFAEKYGEFLTHTVQMKHLGYPRKASTLEGS